MSSLTLTIDLQAGYWNFNYSFYDYGNPDGFYGNFNEYYSNFYTPYTTYINTNQGNITIEGIGSNNCTFSSTSYSMNNNTPTDPSNNFITFNISTPLAYPPNNTTTYYSTKITMDVTLSIEYLGKTYSLDFTVTTNPYIEVVESGTSLISYFILQNSSNFTSSVATNTTKDPSSIFYGSSIVLDRSSYITANNNNGTFGEVTFPLIFQISNISDGSA